MARGQALEPDSLDADLQFTMYVAKSVLLNFAVLSLPLSNEKSSLTS